MGLICDSSSTVIFHIWALRSSSCSNSFQMIHIVRLCSTTLRLLQIPSRGLRSKSSCGMSARAVSLARCEGADSAEEACGERLESRETGSNDSDIHFDSAGSQNKINRGSHKLSGLTVARYSTMHPCLRNLLLQRSGIAEESCRQPFRKHCRGSVSEF
jgi:hypothetical protein